MSAPSSSQAGFSAVELLITIFIAAAFAAAGYQLYVAVVRDGSDARNQATASNLAYQYLRQYSPLATNPCTTITPTPAMPTDPQYASLGPADTVEISATITCPYNLTTPNSGTSLVKVVIQYGTDNPRKKVEHALFVTN